MSSRARLSSLLLSGLSFTLLTPSIAAAQGGVLRVHLDEPAVGITVSVVADNDPWRRWTAAFDRATRATFEDLPPAAYDVILLDAGAVVLRARVTVNLLEVVDVVVGRDGAGDFALTVTDRHRLGEGVTFDRRLLTDLPASRDVWALIETAVPFVIADRMDNGGAETARSALVGSRGASWTATTIAYGNAEARDPGRTGLLDLEPESGAIESVAVSSGLAPVEVDTPGVTVSLAPRRPSAERSAELDASFTSEGMVATNTLPGAPSITRVQHWRELALVGSLPVGTRAGLLVSAVAGRARYREAGAAPLLDRNTTSIFAHAIANPTLRDQIRIVGGAQRLDYPFDDRRQLADPGGAIERAALTQMQATWDRLGPAGGIWTGTAGVLVGRRTPSLPSPAGGTLERVTDGRVPAPPAAFDRVDWNLGVRWHDVDRMSVGGVHALRAGLTVRRTSLASDIVALPVVAESVAGLPARVWVPVAPASSSSRAARHVGLYVADRFRLTSGLTVDAGLRLDAVAGEADGAAEGVAWRTLSPRLFARWAAGPVAVFGGIGVYARTQALALLAHGDPGEAVFDVHRWRDPNGDGRFTVDERDERVARGGLGAAVASIDPALEAPRTREFTIGAEYQLTSRMAVRGALIVRRESQLAASVNTGVPDSGYDVVLVPDANADWDSDVDDRLLPVYDRLPATFGQDRFLLTTPDVDNSTYGGIELGWTLTSPRWAMLFGATAYRTRMQPANRGEGVLENDHHVIGELYHQPNAAPLVYGSGFFDRSYVGKWFGSFHVTDDLRLAFTARYQDGQPFSRLVVVPDLSQGPEMVHAYRMGQTRFTYTATLDARVERWFTVAGRRAAVRLDVFNLTNHRNEVQEDVLTGPNFRVPTAVQPPLTLRLGFRLHF